MCLFKRRNRMVYRNALFYGAFRRGCTAIPQTGVGGNRKKMFYKPHRKMGLLFFSFSEENNNGFIEKMCISI